MNDIVDLKFYEWTKGLGPLEARIAVFEQIRDIPYAIVPELRDPHTGPAGLLNLHKGSCAPKHFLLGLLFSKMEIPLKYVSYLFDWNDRRIKKYPPGLRLLTEGMPITAHLACKAYIDQQWVLVDATYDPFLKDYGFPVNEQWDGISDCKNAVIPVEEIIHETLQERLRYADEHRKSYTEKEKITYARFTEEFNAWLAQIRSSKAK